MHNFFFFLILGNFHTTKKPTFTNLDIIYQVKLPIRAKMTANCYQQINQWKEFGNSGQKCSLTVLTSKKKKIAFLPDTGICHRSQQEWNQNRKLPCLALHVIERTTPSCSKRILIQLSRCQLPLVKQPAWTFCQSWSSQELSLKLFRNINHLNTSWRYNKSHSKKMDIRVYLFAAR